MVRVRPDDIRLSFNEAAEIYDKVRPSYPTDLFDALFQMLPSQPEIVEVGPGTGQATKDLLARGASVLAIEIGPEMAAKLRSNLFSDRLRIEVGDFEVMEIKAGEADAVFSATAYHWITQEAETDRPAAILRPGGLVAVTGPPAPPRGSVDPAIRAVLDADRRFDSVAVRRYDWNQTYSATDYRNLMLSYSGTQMMEEPARAGLLDELESLIRTEFGGIVTRPLVVTLTTATLT
jgi:trans-aconitate methyltransferase